MSRASSRRAMHRAVTRSLGLHGPTGGGCIDGVGTFTLAWWRSLGEAGQFLAGKHAGLSDEQIAAKREWTPAQLRRFRDDAHRARAAHRRERAA